MLQGGAALIFLLGVIATPATVPSHYLDSPVFFERYANSYGEPENLELMPRGEIHLRPLGTESIASFDWRTHQRKDRSWWNRVENFFYLAPFLADGGHTHRCFANDWFDAWFATHDNAKPNKAAWDGMTVGQRTLILVWLFKLESVDPVGSDELAANLTRAIGQHQVFLLNPRNFESRSNHGMWQSLGLLESTRVISNDGAGSIALERLLDLTQRSLSKRGSHLEHSPGYHFTFAQWLGEYVPYLESIYSDPPAAIAEMRTHLREMDTVSWYYYDHGGRVPPIGDSSANQVSIDGAERKRPALLVDREAGFAVFKDRTDSVHRRYVVFGIQSRQHPPQMPFHYHNDALSVYYADAGETILDDAGRYSYRDSGPRRYVKSAAGHNTIVEVARGRQVSDQPGKMNLASNVRHSRKNTQHEISASLFDARAIRTMIVDETREGVTIHDRFEPGHGREFVILWMIGRDVTGLSRTGKATWELHTTSGRGFELTLRTGEGLAPADIELVEGSTQPMLGWRAQGVQRLKPARTIVARASDTSELTTTIRPLD